MPNQVRPITPSEAKERVGSSIPDFVIQAFNELIVESLDSNGMTATITQAEATKRIIAKSHPRITSAKILEAGWLDVEPLFRKAGWSVEFDKPMGYAGETYAPHYIFRNKRG